MTKKQTAALQEKGFTDEQITLIQEVLDAPPEPEEMWKLFKEMEDKMRKEERSQPIPRDPIYIPVPYPQPVPYWPGYGPSYPYPQSPTIWCHSDIGRGSLGIGIQHP